MFPLPSKSTAESEPKTAKRKTAFSVQMAEITINEEACIWEIKRKGKQRVNGD